MINVSLKDGKVLQLENAKTVYEIAGDISRSLRDNALAAKVDGEVCDLRHVIDRDVSLEILTFNDEDGRRAFRHTAAHVLAQAVKRLFPDTKLAIGPAIENGFYYDFEFSKPFTSEDLPAVEEEMRRIIKEGLEPRRFFLDRKEALEMTERTNESYKTELINDLPPDAELSFYEQGDFTDLCAGPHLINTKALKAVKLTNLAGAYWRGSEKNKMLTRIYGTAFTKQADLDEYLNMIEEAKKRDHRKLGKELELFAMLDEGQGLPFFLPNGLIVKNLLVDFWREKHKKAGYVEISTPIMLNKALWELSGHWENYGDNMFATEVEEQEYCIKPMNCPGGILLYQQTMHSYREFPLRMGELGIVHRFEKSGALHGLMRVRCFTQDDAHIFLMPEQIKDEIINIINLTDDIYKTFGFTYSIELSTRPEKSIGTAEQWDKATDSLRAALDDIGKPYAINEGDGAFYGPKIDFHLKDTIGRTWQCGTIQLDFNLPERFALEYITPDDKRERPVMIHRTIYGSLERFIGTLIEHYAGAFPLWLAPVQAIVLPISDKFAAYSGEVYSKLDESGIRAEIDNRPEKIGFKIREALNRRIPYVLVVGEKEEKDGVVALRSRQNGDEGTIGVDALIKRMNGEVKTARG